MSIQLELKGFHIYHKKKRNKELQPMRIHVDPSTKEGKIIPKDLLSECSSLFATFEEPLDSSILIRQNLYKNYYEQFQSSIKDLETKWEQRFVKKVEAFANYISSAGKDSSNQKRTFIGIIQTDENENLMNTILEQVFSDTTMPTVFLTSSKCVDPKSALQNIAKQLFQGNHDASRFLGDTLIRRNDLSSDDDEGEDELNRKIFSNKKEKHVSIHDLNKWYQEQKITSEILIVVEESETLPRNVLPDLLTLLKYLKFSIVLLLGTCSPRGVLSSSLSALQLKNTIIKEFIGSLPEERIESFIEQVTINNLDYPFRLSGRIIDLIRKYFFRCQHSLKRILQIYHICILEHFKKADSIFCQPNLFDLSQIFEEQNPSNMDDKALSTIFANLNVNKESSNSFISSPSKNKKPRMSMNSKKNIREEVSVALQNCYIQIFKWYESCLVIFELGRDIPDDPIPHNWYDFYISCWNGSLFKENEDEESKFGKLRSLLAFCSYKEIKIRLKQALNKLIEYHSRNSTNTLVKIDSEPAQAMSKEIKGFLNSLQDAKNIDEREKAKEVEEEAIPPVRQVNQRPRRRNIKLTEFTENGFMPKKLQKRTEFSKVRERILQFMDRLKATIKNINDIPGISIFIFDDIDIVIQQLFPSVGKEVHHSLTRPASFLHCEHECCYEPDSQTDDLPDTCVLYKLLTEMNVHNIDLNSLFQSFNEIVYPVRMNKRLSVKQKKEHEEKKTETLLRFKQAIEELEFLGLMKTNKKKKDEIIKLGWIFAL